MKGLQRRKGVIATIFVVLATSAGAQSLLYRPSQAATPAQVSENCNATVPFSSFAGKKVVFLAQTKRSRPLGYGSWEFVGQRPAGAGPIPSYETLAGKIGTITSIESDGADFKRVVVKIDGSNLTVSSHALHESISDVVLLDDIQFLKSKYVGKTLWITANNVRTNQDVETFDGIKVKRLMPVKVIDAVPGTFQYEPIDLVVEPEDHSNVLVPLSASLSNIPADLIEGLKKRDRPLCGFDEAFRTENPRLKYNWPDAMWRNIEQGHVVEGMNLDQVFLARGYPTQVVQVKMGETNSTDLIYTDTYAVMLNERGIVTAVQE